MIFLLFFSFLAGFATILAPCIWPLLPLVLSVSSTGGKRKPFRFDIGRHDQLYPFYVVHLLFRSFLHIGPNVFRLAAVVVHRAFRTVAAFSIAGGEVRGFYQPGCFSRCKTASRAAAKERVSARATRRGFSIGLVWAPCAGPILATIATLAATRAVSFQVILVTLAYGLGLGIPLFLVSLSGSVLFAKMRRVTKYTGRVQQAFGLIMICVALLIYTNYDKTLQLKILEAFPSYGNLVNGVENNKTVSDQLDILRGNGPRTVSTDASGSLADLGPAPEFKGITGWLNGPPLTMERLRGKVVLVDFWTYSCINCLRTLPTVKAWVSKIRS